MDLQRACPCHSGKTYEACCAPYHHGKPAPTPRALMRSRYSAYALGLVDYIIETTHSENPESITPLEQRKKQIAAFCKEIQFKGLDILASDESTVTFFAKLFQNGQDVSFKEKSFFKKEDNKWKYVSGTMIDP